MRLIDADRLHNIFKNGMNRIPFIEEDRDMFYHNSGYNCAMTGAYIEVEKAPTIEAAPVVKAEWKYYKKQGIAVCTNCSFERNLDDNFGKAIACPNCGCDMRKGGADQ